MTVVDGEGVLEVVGRKRAVVVVDGWDSGQVVEGGEKKMGEAEERGREKDKEKFFFFFVKNGLIIRK